METDIRNDEIDLVEVFLKLYIFLKKYFILILISGIIGTSLGYSTKFFLKEYFKSEMIIESYTISEKLRINYINQFQSLLDDKNFEILNNETGLEIADLKNIKELSTKTDINKKDEDILFITTQVWDSSVLPKLANGIQSFMFSFSYVKDEIEIFKDNSLSLINDIDIFIKDSINTSHRNYYISSIENNDFFHNEVLDLLKEKQKIEKSLKYATPFRVVQDFTIYQNPVNNYKKNTFLGTVIFIITTILVLVIIELNKKAK